MKTNIKDAIPLISMITTLVVIIIGGYMFIENRYVCKSELNQTEIRLKKTEIRLDIKILNDYIQQTQNRIWILEDRIRINTDDITAKEELRDLKIKKADYEKELNIARSSLEE